MVSLLVKTQRSVYQEPFKVPSGPIVGSAEGGAGKAAIQGDGVEASWQVAWDAGAPL